VPANFNSLFALIDFLTWSGYLRLRHGYSEIRVGLQRDGKRFLGRGGHIGPVAFVIPSQEYAGFFGSKEGSQKSLGIALGSESRRELKEDQA
jgi:hypothetical protein